MRKKSLYKSAAVGLIEESVAILCAFILPRMILVYFGSDCNGIVAAVTQFIGCIALLKSGIGMATKAALYSPLYSHDQNKIEGIMAATMKFLRKVAFIFVIGIIIFAVVYPLVVSKEYSWFFVFSLTLIVSLGTFFQYFFGLGNQLLLEADQKYYIVSFITIINTLFNTLISVACMNAGMSIHGVKLCSAVVFCTTPIILHIYVNHAYHLNRSAKPDEESISKRWDAFGMQIANFVNSNTDIIVASLFLRLREVSVYTIYFLSINAIKKFILKLTVGVEAALGNLIAEKDEDKFKRIFLIFEFILNFVCVVAFSCLCVLIVPFVLIYTRGVTDADYLRPAFGLVACAAELFFCLRLAYTFVTQARGDFAETKRYYYIEAALNIVSSVILVNVLGLVGIVVGTLLAMIFRTVMFAKYVYQNVLHCNFMYFVERILFTVAVIALNYCICIKLMSNMSIDNYLDFTLFALMVCIVSLATTTVLHFARYKALFAESFNMILSKKKNKRK